MSKPKIFIGSSSERLSLARALKQDLRHEAVATLWNEGVFSVGNSTLDDLLRAVDEYDFAIFIFAPDDLTTMRKEQKSTVRDNVVFELGLFMGRLGKERTVWVVPSGGSAYVPTDLTGIKPVQFDLQMESVEAAAGYAGNDIRKIIQARGRRTDNRLHEVDQPRILCAASRQWAEFGFEKDIELLGKRFSDVTVSKHLTSEELSSLLTQSPWHILHLVGFVHAESGDFCFSAIDLETKELGAKPSKIPARGLVKLVEAAEVILVVLATCDSLALAAQLARVTNVVAAAADVTDEQVMTWGDLFYGLLAKGKPLSQAFDIAKEASDAPLVLITRKDFCVTGAKAQ